MNILKYISFVSLLFISYSATSMVVLRGRLQGINNVRNLKIISTIKSATSFSFETTTEIPVKKDGTFNFRLDIIKAKTLFVECAGFSYEILVQPNDTVFFNFFRSSKTTAIKSEMTETSSNQRLTLSGNNRYQYAFFDTLEKKTGILSDLPVNNIEDADLKKRFIDSLFQERICFLDKYSKDFHLSQEIKDLAHNEIEGSYFESLIFLVFKFDKNTLPDNYFTVINKENFNWGKCSESRQFMAALRNYITFYLRTTAFGTASDENNFNEQFQIINSRLADTKLRDYFLTFLMNDYLERSPQNYESLYKQYITICLDTSYKAAISSKYSQIQRLTKNILRSDLLDKTRIIKLSDNTEITLRTLINEQKNNFIVIDFWAKWCGPCLLQIPYAISFEKKYSKKASFAFLSLDKNVYAFKEAVKSAKLNGEQYFLADGFNSPLAIYLRMKSIPRYIVIDKALHLVKITAPFPADTAAFTKMLVDL